MDPKLVNEIQRQQIMLLYALRYEWLRTHGSCPFAETDAAWDTPELLDKAIDDSLRLEAKQSRQRI